MSVLPITIHRKHAVYTGAIPYVCSNGDYEVVFTFDAGWDAYTEKTARFCVGELYVDRIFTGNTCTVPVFEAGDFLQVGVYAGNLQTSTAAMIRMCDSIRTAGGVPAEPEAAVYDQIMERLNSALSGKHVSDCRIIANPAENTHTLVLVYNDGTEMEHPLPQMGIDIDRVVMFGKKDPDGNTHGEGKQLYVNTASGKIWICEEKTEGVNSWIPIAGGGTVEVDTTLTVPGMAADAAVVGEKLDTLFAVEWMATKTGSDAPEKVIFPEQSTTGILQSLQEAIQPGYEYDVTVNGAKYTCTAGEHSDGVYIGNAALAGDDDKPHNNEPFCILWYGGSATGAMFYKDSTLAFPVTVKVTDHSEVVYNKLPKEFLPDGIGGGGGMSATAINLLIDILESAVYSTNVSGKIASLKEALLAGGSGGGDTGGDTGGGDMPDNPVEPDEPVVPDDITVSGGVMTIISVGSEIAVSDGVMTIA